ncbi:MAG: tRNA (cytidine(34)-2'-O)-methyltransferase [Gammaproteobacteria bacterium]|nr:tRNA (cytidine(34)-2'-O)-methyltransferase [Gammaproteobacteria bacterium]
MFDIILFEPEIAPNTGNVIRLCANAGTRLHLIEPLGFELDEPRLRRAGLDYHELTVVRTHPSLHDCLQTLAPANLYAFSRRASRCYTSVGFAPGDALLFGPETRGLPAMVLEQDSVTATLRLPMRPGNRSLNLSNAVAIACYEAWRQSGFAGAEDDGGTGRT